MIVGFDEALDDLFARFLLNLPAEELASHSRLGFQIEQAFWFYVDFYRPDNPALPKLNLRQFGLQLLARFPEWTASLGIDSLRLFADFFEYKSQVPTCGTILLNQDCTKCLMVMGFVGNSWGFPKGKIGKDESPLGCAVRETFEETGFDCSGLIDKDQFIQWNNPESQTRLYIVVGVPESTVFTPQTRREIRKIGWHPIADLEKKDVKYYNVTFFSRRLKSWLKKRGQPVEGRRDGDAASSSLAAIMLGSFRLDIGRVLKAFDTHLLFNREINGS